MGGVLSSCSSLALQRGFGGYEYAPLETLGAPERAPRGPRGLQRAPARTLKGPERVLKCALGPLNHKFVSKQLAELKWDPFRTLKSGLSTLSLPAVGPLRSEAGPPRYEMGRLRHVMCPLNSVMGPLRPGMCPLRP